MLNPYHPMEETGVLAPRSWPIFCAKTTKRVIVYGYIYRVLTRGLRQVSLEKKFYKMRIVPLGMQRVMGEFPIRCERAFRKSDEKAYYLGA